jgi:hypothetical protein
MSTEVRSAKLVHVNHQAPRGYRLPVLVAALAAAGLLSLGPANATIIHDYDGNEPNDDLANATLTSSISDEFEGCVGISCLASLPSTVSPDSADYVGYSGLDLGATYKLSLTELGCSGCLGDTNALDFAVFLNGSSSATYFQTLGPDVGLFTFSFPNLTNISSIVVGVTFGEENPNGCCEGYRVALAQAGPGTAPEPATLALVAAGLAGAFVARRRKRT